MPLKDSLLADIASYNVHRGPACGLCAIPNKKILEEVNEVMRTRGACHRAMHTALQKRKVNVSIHSISNHYLEGHYRASTNKKPR